MCFEWLLQAFARWQPGILFDIAAKPILEYRWIDSYSQPSLRTQFKVATVYLIHTQSLSWCSTGLVPNVLPRKDEVSGTLDIRLIRHYSFDRSLIAQHIMLNSEALIQAAVLESYLQITSMHNNNPDPSSSPNPNFPRIFQCIFSPFCHHVPESP